MAAELKTLDVPERQVLVDFWEDEDGYFWHHQLLLLQASQAGRWLVATPDLEVQLADLSTHRVVPLQRSDVFPATYRGTIYAFDPDIITGAQIEVLRRSARFLLEIMGGAPTS